jgi:hypothetical protein
LKKIHSKFSFEKVIYADRFMNKNKKKSEGVRIKIDALKKKKALLEESISSYKEYQKSIPLETILGQAVDFLSKQSDDEFVNVDKHNDNVSYFNIYLDRSLPILLMVWDI